MIKFFHFQNYSGCSKKLMIESRAAAIIQGRNAMCLNEESGAYIESGTVENSLAVSTRNV